MYKQAQIMKIICKGSLNSNIHFGMPKLAFSSWYIYKLAGKMATSKAIIPQAAKLVNLAEHKSIPKIISAKPAVIFKSFGLGRYGGIILRYIFGFLK